MKSTLLELVQDILNDLDSDLVNSIDDTVEAGQVAQIIKSCYDEIISNRNWPHLKRLTQLEAFNSLSKPNYLKLPTGTKELIKFEYDCRKATDTALKYRKIKYLYPDEFLSLIHQRDSDRDNISVITDDSGIQLSIIKNQAPTYWTSFNDTDIVLDSYDSAVDDTLKKSKTSAICYIETPFVMEDSFIPNLPDEAFALLREESKSTAFLALKQMSNPKAEMKAGRQQRWLARKAWKAHGGIRYETFGRKGLK